MKNLWLSAKSMKENILASTLIMYYNYFNLGLEGRYIDMKGLKQLATSTYM